MADAAATNQTIWRFHCRSASEGGAVHASTAIDGTVHNPRKTPRCCWTEKVMPASAPTIAALTCDAHPSASIAAPAAGKRNVESTGQKEQHYPGRQSPTKTSHAAS